MSNDVQDSDRNALLVALESHGREFLSLFGSLPQPRQSEPKRKRRKVECDTDVATATTGNDDDNEEEDEWRGFGPEILSPGDDFEDYSDGSSESGDDEGNEDMEDDNFRSDLPTTKQPEVVVFSRPSKPDHPRMSKLQAKAFMSSKVSKLREDMGDRPDLGAESDGEHNYEERTNMQNDALLHKLVHTQLLSGSMNSELNMTPAQRRKALEGRVLELAAGAKLGKGGSAVRKEERMKASKKVRMGLERKVEERQSIALEEAKNLGNYHHSIKHLFEAPSTGQTDRKKRERGLKLSIGKFSGGVLKLSKDDVASLQGGAVSGRRREWGRGTGGGRGRGRGRVGTVSRGKR